MIPWTAEYHRRPRHVIGANARVPLGYPAGTIHEARQSLIRASHDHATGKLTLAEYLALRTELFAIINQLDRLLEFGA
jgi:hypothetical protein